MNIWYAHYPGDYGRDTAHLSLVQHGAYRLLLDHYYATAKPLPRDMAAIRRICRATDQTECEAVAFVLTSFFEERTDGYHNKRADSELVRQAAIREKQSKKGKKGAGQRWQGHDPGNGTGNAPANAPAIAEPQSQSQSQSLVTPIRKEKSLGA